jgi:MFS transporter, PAT family, beta-lactamase induction signal transducer AmpG
MHPNLYLSVSARVRFTTGMLMYFAQGVPTGLLAIALPTWLAEQGAEAGEIGAYLAIVFLPWTFKLLSGPLMDRYQFPSMGRRRPWVLAAQLGLTLSLLALIAIDDPIHQMGLLMACGLLVNVFSAMQDVAVDGMAIELVPESEQGRLNAFMSFGKAVGWAASSAISAVILVNWGLGVAALLASLCSAILLFGCLMVREREGEKLLPWSEGAAAGPVSGNPSFHSLFKGLGGVLWSRISLVVIAIMFCDGLIGGYGNALTPIAAINLFGFTTQEWSQLAATMGLVGAVVSLGMGPVIDRFGAKRMLVFIIMLVAAHAFTLAGTQHYWQDSTYVRVMMSLWVLLGPITMVCMIALAMAVCSPQVSATQFAIYMSISNLGGSLGSAAYGLVADKTSFVQDFALVGAMFLVTLIAVSFYRSREFGAADVLPQAR